MTRIRILALMISAVILVTGCAAVEPVPVEDIEVVGSVNEGEPAVNFEFVDYEGRMVSLSDLEGSKVYLKYVASWCSICNRGMPELDELFAKDRDFAAYMVVTPNANGEMNIEDYKEWFDQEAYPHIVILFDVDAEFARRLGALAVPTSIFIGSDGILIQSKPGHTSNEDIETMFGTFE